MATSKTTSLLSEWWRWWKTLAFVDALAHRHRGTGSLHGHCFDWATAFVFALTRALQVPVS